MSQTTEVKLPTRRLDPQLVELLRSLQPGQRIRIVQTIRVGRRQWQTTVVGVFRQLDYLATGIVTERVPEDDVVVPVIHFTKDNGELSSITLDEKTVLTLEPPR